MSTTPDIRLASFAAVVFLYLQVTVIVCQNAAISGCADSQRVNSSLTLKCQYIGKGDVEAIYWYNGSNADVLVLRPGSNVPHCEVFLTTDISFDPHRINYTCNALSNVYTLTINPLQKLDNNITWSCTFLDPEPDPVKAESIIHLSDITDVTAGDGRISGSLSIDTIVIALCGCVTVVAVTIIVIILWRRRRNICYGHNREQYAGVCLSSHLLVAECHCQLKDDGFQTIAQAVHHEQEPYFACTRDKEDPRTFLD